MEAGRTPKCPSCCTTFSPMVGFMVVSLVCSARERVSTNCKVMHPFIYHALIQAKQPEFDLLK